MTILVDASALVAMATREPDARELGRVLQAHAERLYCAVGLWEAAIAIARKRTVTVDEARGELTVLMDRLDIRPVGIGEEEARAALAAHTRYGRGNHPAKLNMGDCFAYACARTNNARLLYKGNDFSHTDVAQP